MDNRSFSRNLINRLLNRFSSFRTFSSVISQEYEYYILESNPRKRLEKRVCYDLSPDLIVLNGPFKGMIYPDIENTGYGTFVPKLLGTYEKELHPLINELKNTPYRQIIDIGCAEGYYIVGMALILKEAQIYGYEINEKSLSKSQKLAMVNNVSDRVHLNRYFSKETFREFNFKLRTLIICDIEGGELDLFTDETARHLEKVDLLIELHDIKRKGCKKGIINSFHQTHDYTIIESQERKVSDFPSLSHIKNEEAKVLLEERPEKMEWIFLTPKK